ncbi:methyltransferase domain-containing protein [candidate division WOR-3 bacterium]|uniref:Methyltransferase domain-containing protein n=1 Tax=candidate division WOR-3 bacterium TaxID=2052148 RepID=A0A9D5QCI5_UNCW3|nr:methyltransferase domain-containing protein [candidate division WOR-3 bacterium]MBD3364589.1 methyltransferase domain-containing protein [candidate division WOR-3 bacterium]
MAGISERVYPKDMDQESVDNIQGVMYKVFTTRYRVAARWVLEHFGNKGKVRIIDIACGSGYGSEILSRAGNVLGVDLDPEVIEYAKENYSGKRTSFTLGNANDFEFLDGLGKFDAVVSLATVEHVDDADAYMNWIYRALNPGGVAVVCFPSVVTMDWAIPHHKRDITRRGARRLFSRNGFEVARDYYQNHKLDMRHLINEVSHPENEIPVPPLKHWISYYLTHPHHAVLRAWEATAGGGVHFGDQEYLLVPDG